MDHIELWDKAKALMREELANVSYTTWIEQPLKPVYVVDDKLALEVISDFNEKTIRARYLSMITAAVSQAAGREMTIELMSVKERIEWQERQKKEEAPAMPGHQHVQPEIDVRHVCGRLVKSVCTCRRAGRRRTAGCGV